MSVQKTSIIASTFLVVLIFGSASAFSQGTLTPPGPPGPTMTTLDQLDTKLDATRTKLDATSTKLDQTLSTVNQINARADRRIPIDASHTLGDNASEFIIPATAAGNSYYLTGNVNVGKANGIQVLAPNVTIDLNGFAVQRTSGGGSGGILVQAGADGCVIKNGSIRGFDYGLQAVPNFNTNVQAAGGTVLHISVTSCTSSAIGTGPSWIIEDCVAVNNGQGISAGIGSTIKNCVASNNTIGTFSNGIGINTGGGAVLGCTASGNKGFGIRSVGATAIANCSAELNGSGFQVGDNSTVNNCSAANNKAAGIEVGSRTIVTRCTADANAKDGISGASNCDFFDNSVTGNGIGSGVTNGAGIHVSGNANRIHANHITSNDVGILAQGTGNLIDANHVRNNTGPGIQVTTPNGKNVVTRNVAGDNVNSYTGIAPGNNVAPIDTNFSATNPLANFQN